MDYYTEIDAVSIVGIIETKRDKPQEIPETICEKTENNSELEEKSVSFVYFVFLKLYLSSDANGNGVFCLIIFADS